MDIKVRDSNGALLAEGDSVTLIKDLKLKGSSTVLKRGTMIKGIHLTDNADEIEGRTDKIKGLVLRTEFLKKALGKTLGEPPVICPSGGLLTGLSSLISDFPKNILVPIHPKSILELFASHPTRGAYHDRHGRGEGCGGRGSGLRATGSQGGLAKGL